MSHTIGSDMETKERMRFIYTGGLRKQIGRISEKSGAAGLYTKIFQPSGAVVLMYHSISKDNSCGAIDPKNTLNSQIFEEQMKFLVQKRNVISYSNLIESLEDNKPLPPGTVCITFDDGYLDNYTIAAPLLARYNLPAIVFLSTGYVTRGENQWADDLNFAFMHRSENLVSLPNIDLRHTDISTENGARLARRILSKFLLESSYTDRKIILDELYSQTLPRQKPMRSTMTWSDVRSLLNGYKNIELGGHTRNHLDIRSNPITEYEEEIDGCREDILRETGVFVKHFSFPYGRWTEGAKQHLSTNGWRSSTSGGTKYKIRPGCGRYEIHRVAAMADMDEFSFVTGGAFPGLLNMFGISYYE